MGLEPEVRAAAVVYRPGKHERQALANFARAVAAGGRRVDGMVQEAFFDDQGRRMRIDSVDLATGDRVTINKPNEDQLAGGGCSLDTAALIDAGEPLRRALARKSELVVIEKFGEQEQAGAGLMDDIVAVIAEGVPALVLVPEDALADWRELTGGEIAELPCESKALERWWRQCSRQATESDRAAT